MTIIECEQRTPEWFAARLGMPSASCFDRIITTDGKPSKQRTKYMFKLAAEKITGLTEDAYQNQAMLNGTLREEDARSFYEMTHGVEVRQVGLCMAPNGLYCASPDGLIGEHGLLEIKSPESATHISYLLNSTLPIDYFQQVQGQLLVTGRKWVDFISYYSAIKPFVIRVERDEGFILKLKGELELFCQELKEIVRKVS